VTPRLVGDNSGKVDHQDMASGQGGTVDMPDQIPQGFFETPAGIPNPAIGGIDVAFTFWAVGQPAAVRAKLGLDLNISVIRFRASLPSYPGWTYEGYMTPVSGHEPPEAPTIDCWQLARYPIQGVLRHRRVCHEGSALSLEVRWHPETGETNAMVWPSTLPLKIADKYRATALRLLREVERRGRRSGPDGFKDTQEFG